MRIDKKVCVIGLGYIGLPTAALLANRGYEVHGVDVSPRVVETINQGKIHIVEPDLDSFVQSAVNSGRLKAEVRPIHSDIFIIAVPTPFHDGFVPNIDYVLQASAAIAPYLAPGNIIILESTSPVGTTEKVADKLRENGVNTDSLFIAHCPERVLPGQIMKELVQNDRIVGGITPKASKQVAEFYRTFVTGEVLETDARTAEMTKLTENSFRDVNIAFANELSMLCDKFGIDTWELIKLANRHPRVNILQPGTGVGGHCIAVDPWFIVHEGGDTARLIQTGRHVNLEKTEWVKRRISQEVADFSSSNERAPVVACMGLAFKPNIDDLRESPAVEVHEYLAEKGYDLLTVEPNICSHKDFELTDPSAAVEKADIVVYLVAHKGFSGLETSARVLDFCGVTRR